MKSPAVGDVSSGNHSVGYSMVKPYFVFVYLAQFVDAVAVGVSLSLGEAVTVGVEPEPAVSAP